MNRMILFSLTYSIYLTTLDQVDFKNNLELNQEDQSFHDQKIHELEEQLKTLKSQRLSSTPPLQKEFASRSTFKPKNKDSNHLNFTEYNREDALTGQKQITEDKFLKENWEFDYFQ